MPAMQFLREEQYVRVIRWLVTCGLIAVLLTQTVASWAGSGEFVTFTSLRNALSGEKVTINALIFKPEGAEPGRRLPAVVALHGCGGMYSTLASRKYQLSMRHQNMADLIVSQGYIALYPDSFRSRGVEQICTERISSRSVHVTDRVNDVIAAAAYLQSRPDVDPGRIALLGWSHGAMTALSSINEKDDRVAAQRSYFKTAIAFYPGCRESIAAKEGYSLALPLKMLLGGLDNWTAPGPCIELARKFEGSHEPVVLTVYPDAYHGFDEPGSRTHQRYDIPGLTVTVGSNPEARADAYAKVKEYLKEAIGKEYSQ